MIIDFPAGPENRPLQVIFPYPFIYPEQYNYINHLKRSVDKHGVSCLEMPSGTGKTIALLSFLVAYKQKYPDIIKKIIYCPRTVPEINKTLVELDHLVKARKKINPKDSTIKLAVGVSSRTNLCIHESVSKISNRVLLDSMCRDKTLHESDSKCSFFTNLFNNPKNKDFRMNDGIYTLQQLLDYGRANHLCPYFCARSAIHDADVLVWSYQYMLDPRIGSHVATDLEQNSVVIFDEAHNIDSVCLSTLSITLDRTILSGAHTGLIRLKNKVYEMEQSAKKKLHNQYQTLLNGLLTTTQKQNSPIPSESSIQNRLKQMNPDEIDEIHPSYQLAPSLIDAAIPGNIRQSSHFISYVFRFISFLKCFLRSTVTLELKPIELVSSFQKFEQESTGDETLDTRLFVESLEKSFISPSFDYSQIPDMSYTASKKPSNIQEGSKEVIEMNSSLKYTLRTLKFLTKRLSQLMRDLHLEELYKFYDLRLLVKFCTFLASFHDHPFLVILESYDHHLPQIRKPILQFVCLDASLAIQPVFEKYRHTIITSGTLSPLDLYPKILNFEPITIASFPMSLSRKCLRPIVVAHGNDQTPLTTSFDHRADESLLRNYGELIFNMCKTVPDGIAVFFPSYSFMEKCIGVWDSMICTTKTISETIEIPQNPLEYANNLEKSFVKKKSNRKLVQTFLEAFLDHKLLFFETQNVAETQSALMHFRKACDIGRGACLFAVARGKASEGVDFDHHYGRCVILIGVPYVYVHSRVLQARLEHLESTFSIPRREFLAFDAMRHSAQCMGRVIRSKTDYGLMVFADKRFSTPLLKKKLPPWIQECFDRGYSSVAIRGLVHLSKSFLREMAQNPFSFDNEISSTHVLQNLKQVEDL